MATLQAGKYAVAARPRMRPSFWEGVLQIAKDLSLPVSLFNWPDGDAVETNTTALAVQAQGETQCDQHPRGTVSATNTSELRRAMWKSGYFSCSWSSVLQSSMAW